MEDISTPVAKGVKLRPETILRPNAEIGTPGFQDATDQEQAIVDDRKTEPHQISKLRLNEQEQADAELQRKRDSLPYPNHTDDPDPLSETEEKKESPYHINKLRNYSYQLLNTYNKTRMGVSSVWINVLRILVRIPSAS